MENELRIDERPTLRRPVLIAAFRGWNDGGQAATLAGATLVRAWDARRFAEIDPEGFIDFQSTRPTVTLVDGLIVARSTFNSSVAYRSVVVFGSARLVSDEEERRSVLDALVEGLLPGRLSEVRASSESELRRTGIVVVDIEDASAKISAGPPEDDEEDVAGHAWAGEIPLVQKAGAPIAAPDGIVGDGLVEIPPSVRRFVDLR